MEYQILSLSLSPSISSSIHSSIPLFVYFVVIEVVFIRPASEPGPFSSEKPKVGGIAVGW